MGSRYKQLVIATAVMMAAGGIVVGLRICHARDVAERGREVAAEVREEARTMIGYCEGRAGLANDVAMGTSKFGMYLATGDRAQLRRVMTDVVERAISAYELACATAKTDIAFVQANAGEPDSWTDAKAQVVADQIAYLARVRVAAAALATSIDAAPNDVVIERRTELEAAAKP